MPKKRTKASKVYEYGSPEYKKSVARNADEKRRKLGGKGRTRSEAQVFGQRGSSKLRKKMGKR